MNGEKIGVYLKDKWNGVFHGSKSRTLLFLGIAGMSLILLSTVLPMGGAKQNPPLGAQDTQTAEQYVARLETRLTSIVGSVEGVGRCEVMVTTANGAENIYAIEESQNASETNSYEGDAVRKQTQQQNTEQKYIVVDAGSGKKEALLKTQRQPTVQGVVIVCEGAGSMVVQERVTQVVTTALGIPYNKVCVTKISK